VSYINRNVAQQQNDPQSLLSLYHRLIELRREHAALHSGAARVISADSNVLIYERALPEQRIAVVLNFGRDTQQLPQMGQGRLLLSTDSRAATVRAGEVRGNEGLLFLLAKLDR
jgi:glycosidase